VCSADRLYADFPKALPNCKTEWDDPAEATTPQPTASGAK